MAPLASRHHRMAAVPRPAPRAQPPAVAPPSALGSPTAASQQPGLTAMPLQPAWLWVLCSATLCVMLCVITGGFGGGVTLWVITGAFGGGVTLWVITGGFGGGVRLWVITGGFGGGVTLWVITGGFGGGVTLWAITGGFGGGSLQGLSWLIRSLKELSCQSSSSSMAHASFRWNSFWHMSRTRVTLSFVRVSSGFWNNADWWTDWLNHEVPVEDMQNRLSWSCGFNIKNITDGEDIQCETTSSQLLIPFVLQDYSKRVFSLYRSSLRWYWVWGWADVCVAS